MEDTSQKVKPLYQSVLGPLWNELPPEIRAMHDFYKHAEAKGIATVRRGTSPLAQFIGDTVGFPPAGENVPVQVIFTVSGHEETWQRSFDGKTFSSVQYAGGSEERLIIERFGQLAFTMALIFEKQKLRLVLRRWSAFGIPMPMFLCPKSEAYESVENGKFNFNVEISHPLVGLIVHYKGWLLRKS